MKQNHVWLGAAVLAVGLTLASPQIVPALRAQAQTAPTTSQGDQEKAQVFVGKIIKTKSGQYALLIDQQNGKGSYLDDQDKVKDFEGKMVKVTGVLEAAKNLIHVKDIQLA